MNVKAFVAIAALLCAGSAAADDTMKVKPWVWDGADSGLCAAAWVAKIGLPDGPTSKSNHGLALAKNTETSVWCAGGANVAGPAFPFQITGGTQFAFDYKGYCGAGAPRFNVVLDNERYFFLGCTYGVHTDLGNGWTRVAFSLNDAYPADGGASLAVGDKVAYVQLVFDEGPAEVVLDNVFVNGIVMAQPGNGTVEAPIIRAGTIAANDVDGTTETGLGSGLFEVCVDGTWTNSVNVGDAKFVSTNDWVNSHDYLGALLPQWGAGGDDLGAGFGEVQVNGQFVNWGAYSTSHHYCANVNLTSGSLNLAIFDGHALANQKDAGWYGDNGGTLTFTVRYLGY